MNVLPIVVACRSFCGWFELALRHVFHDYINYVSSLTSFHPFCVANSILHILQWCNDKIVQTMVNTSMPTIMFTYCLVTSVTLHFCYPRKKPCFDFSMKGSDISK